MRRFSLGADPGTANYGYSAVMFWKHKGLPLKVKLVEIGMFTSVVTNLTNKPAKLAKSKRRKSRPNEMEPPLPLQFKPFMKEWEDLMDQYKPVKFSAERFQTRGIKGKTIEAVSMMNGSVITLADQRNIVYEVFIASAWKNLLNGSAIWNVIFAGVIMFDKKTGKNLRPLEKLYKLVSIPPHIVDSVLINVHGILNKYGLKWADVDVTYIVNQLREYTYEK